jgi:hypothetical protein
MPRESWCKHSISLGIKEIAQRKKLGSISGEALQQKHGFLFPISGKEK